jgi:hypothetical protein
MPHSCILKFQWYDTITWYPGMGYALGQKALLPASGVKDLTEEYRVLRAPAGAWTKLAGNHAQPENTCMHNLEIFSGLTRLFLPLAPQATASQPRVWRWRHTSIRWMGRCMGRYLVPSRLPLGR